MTNPSYADALRVCVQDLSERGHIAVVDFHDTSSGWFRRWMGWT